MASRRLDNDRDPAIGIFSRLRAVWTISPKVTRQRPVRSPHPDVDRLLVSREERPYDVSEFLEHAEQTPGTVLYLAYGSNLSNETFRGNRGIRPISQINVQVPSLRLTFDLPGIPYTEPCFANTGRRDPAKDVVISAAMSNVLNEKAVSAPDDEWSDDYHKDRWHKGLVGVVYEVTPQDYAHIIATEGGGAGYLDILVECYPFGTSDPNAPVPQVPDTPVFKAHTLFAPREGSGKGGRHPRSRPNPGYAQPSARYLKLLTDGAAELQLPYEYQNYLKGIRPYTITNNKQRVGQFVFISLWVPFLILIFALGRMFADKKGRIPDWLKAMTNSIFSAEWETYDSFFKDTFGDGERTISDGGQESTGSFSVSSGRIKLTSDEEVHRPLGADKPSGAIELN